MTFLTRHCEERSDAAVYAWIATPCGLAMTIFKQTDI